MAYIKLEDTSVTFSIYNPSTRSIRNSILNVIGSKMKVYDNNLYIKALDSINCIIKDGDRVGLIGHNGAGKSTLLKLLSSIYVPTSGIVEVEGSTSSLVDITMGMDGEFTGIKNIINRCIFMGLTFKEAKAISKDIINFSELNDYIHLPTRTYSTGMYLRLAFAIATSVMPDILIMDEMLGTGDANFIKKARKRIMDLIESTKIMVLASHDLSIMREICNRGIWMEQGKIKMDSDINTVLEAYIESISK